MRINQMNADPAHRQRCAADLEALCRQPGDSEARPCPGCSIPCSCSGSPTCTCGCSTTCSQAPRQMSSDPDHYPVEEGIVPLVYALNTLRVCQPCWSCEGHYGPLGVLRKLPRVWFYSRSLVYPDVLAEYLSELKIARRLASTWNLCVVHWGDSMASAATAFSLEPKFTTDDVPKLAVLRKDVRTIAADMSSNVEHFARRRLAQLRRPAA